MPGTLFRRELRSQLNSQIATTVIVLFLLIMGGLFFLHFFEEPQPLTMRQFFSNAPMLLAFFCPALTMGMLAQEKRVGTLELLQTMPITNARIVLEKFGVSLTILFFVLIFTLSYPLSLSTLGDLDWGPVIGGYIALFLLGAAYCAIGLWASGKTSDQVVAILLAFFLSFALTFVDRLAFSQTGTLASILQQFSASYHFQNIARGVIDFRDILFSLSLIAVALLATISHLSNTKIKNQAFEKNTHNALPLTIFTLILIVANACLANQSIGRWDLTAEQRYTLSPTTLQAVGNLPSKVTVKAFFTPDMPAPDHDLAGRFRDTLSEYEAASNGKLRFEIIAPETADDEEKAKGFGLRKIAISQKDKNQISMQMVYKGAAIMFENQAEVIPEIRATDNFEYLLTKSILNLTRKQSKKIGILQGFGSISEKKYFLDSMEELFKEIYGNLITVEPVQVTDQCGLSAPVDAVVVLNVREPLTDCALMALDQVLMNGHSLAIFQSPTASDFFQPDQPRIPIDHRLYPLLEKYGVILNKDLLLDRNKNLVGTEITEDGSVPVSLPALPIIRTINRESPMTQNLSAIIMPFSGTVSITDALKQNPDATVTTLLQSSPESVTRQAGGDITWEALSKPRDSELPGPHSLAIAVEAPFQSYFATSTPAGLSKPQNFIPQTDNARLLVVSNGEFMFSQKTIGYAEEMARYGVHFFINTMDWLAQDQELVAIRNRNLPPMLTSVDDDTQKRIIYINVLGIPLFVLLLSMGWRTLQKWRRRKIEKVFSESEK